MSWTAYDSGGAALERAVTDLPVGTVVGTARTTAPSGWLLCDGASYSTTTYPELFAATAYRYGGSGGSFNVPDSSGDMILAQSQATRLDVAWPPQLVTSLPANPVDGQTVHYLADSTTGAVWTLRYRAASSSSYRWEFVGGAPIMREYTAGFETLSASTTGWVDAPTVGPKYDVALPGDYEVQAQVAAYRSGSGVVFALGIAKGATNPVGSQSLTTDTATSNAWDAVTFVGIITGATTDVRMRYYQSAGSTVLSSERRMLVRPVRVG